MEHSDLCAVCDCLGRKPLRNVRTQMNYSQWYNSPLPKEYNGAANSDTEQIRIDKESKPYFDKQKEHKKIVQDMYKLYYAFTDQTPYWERRNEFTDISNISLGERTLAKNPERWRGLSSIQDDINLHHKVSSKNNPEYRSNKPSPNNTPDKISRHNVPISQVSKTTSPHNIIDSYVIDKTSQNKPHSKTIEHSKIRGSAVDIFVSSEAWVKDACSCTNCDSYHCFALRYQSESGCCCKECKHSQSCLFYKQLKELSVLDSDEDINKTGLISLPNKDFVNENSLQRDFENTLRKAKPKLPKSTIQERITVKKSSSTSLTKVSSVKVLPTPCYTCKDKDPLNDDFELQKKVQKYLGHAPRQKDAQEQNDELFTSVKDYVYKELNKINAVFRSAMEAKQAQMEPANVDVSTSKTTGILNIVTKLFGVLYNSQKIQTFDNEDKASSVINIDIGKNDVTNNKTQVSFSDCNLDRKDKRDKPDENTYNEIIEDIEKQLLEAEGYIGNTPSFKFKTPAADLEAQIMNVFYREEDNPHRSRPVKNIFDLFERIKAAYDICNCKVCECIGIDPAQTKTDKCKCKPCDCDDCNNSKKSCKPKGLAYLKKYSITDCHCKVCQCVKCGESISEPCSCKPCECVKCKSKESTWKRSQRFVVATAHEGSSCTCDSCGCGHCTFRCDNSNNQARFTLDIGTEQPPNLNCNYKSCANDDFAQDDIDGTCDRYAKTMRKLCVKDTSEYDIRLDCKNDNDAIKKITVRDILIMLSMAPDQLCSINFNNLRVASKIKIKSQDLANANSTLTGKENVRPLNSGEYIDFIVPNVESKRKNNIISNKDKSNLYYTFTDEEFILRALSNSQRSFEEISSAEEKQDCLRSPDYIYNDGDPNYLNPLNINPKRRFRKPLPTSSPSFLRNNSRIKRDNNVSDRPAEDLTREYSQGFLRKDDYRVCDTNNIKNFDSNTSKHTAKNSFKTHKFSNSDKLICIEENRITQTVRNHDNKTENFVSNNIFYGGETVQKSHVTNNQRKYSTIKRTIQESKQFSLELLKNLEIFKQANRNKHSEQKERLSDSFQNILRGL